MTYLVDSKHKSIEPIGGTLVNPIVEPDQVFHNIVEDDLETRPVADEAQPNTKFELAFEKAAKTYKKFAENDGKRAMRYQSDAYVFLSNCLALHEVSVKFPEKRDEMLKSLLVTEKRKADNEFHATVQAVVPAPDRKAKRASISQYGQCLCILSLRKIPPNKVVEEMKKDEQVGKRMLSGITKMLRLYAELPEVKKRNDERRSIAQTEREKAIEVGLDKAKPNSIGECTMTEADFFEPGQTVVLIASVNSDRTVTIIGAVQDPKTVDLVLNRQFGGVE